MTDCRARLAVIVNNKYFTNAVIALILFNAVTLGLETDRALMASHAGLMHTIDRAVLWIFVVELALRIYVLRGPFFRSGWNVFDFVIVGISLIPHVGPFSMLRTLRILRVFRLISTVPTLRKVVSALLISIPGMASVLSILFLVFYVSSVMTTQIFGVVDDPKMYELYGTIGNSMSTLFQLMTMDNWVTGIAAVTMVHFPNAMLFFAAFIIITSFAVLNLFIGIIVDALNIVHDTNPKNERSRIHEAQMQVLNDIKADVERLLEKTGAKKK
ncbi:MAG: ion transporter [Alphaproteobacteria bacterium]|nr:ion transporter [Alphaproteobacteria bacterium]